MENETPVSTRPSFFDDDDLNLTYQFVKPEKTHQKDLNHPPMLKDTLMKKLPGSATQSEGFYAIHSRLLVCYKNSSSKIPESVLDLNFAKLKAILPNDDSENFGFSLSRNDITFEFYSTQKQVAEDWIEVLKEICVLSTFHDDYKALKMIGRGSFAKVYLVESKATGKMYAVKAFTKEGIIISNKQNAKPSMLNEIDIMRSLDHENIIKLYEVHETENSIYLVLELIQGKSLQDALKKTTFKEEYSEVKIVNMIRSILDALAYLASKGMMHRDLKPDNILLDKESKIKIADFGLATLIDLPEYIFKKCGTPGYIAPEVFKYDPKNPVTGYDDKCDVFSAGCIFYYMLFGYPFFEGQNASEILRMNRKFTFEFDAIYVIKQELKNQSSKISKDALNLLLQLLELDPMKRITAEEALSHPYFIPVPNGMLKVEGSNDLITNPLSKSAVNSPNKITGTGKTFFGGKTDSPKSPALNPVNQQSSRFAQKNSFFLDMGKPELNGKIDTLTAGSSNNNSVLLNRQNSNASVGSNNGSDSPSHFSNQKSLFKRSRSMKTYNPMASTGQSFLKAAIFRNMAKNQNDMPDEENKEVESLQIERRHSDNAKRSDFSPNHRSATKSPERDDSADNSPSHFKSTASPAKITSNTKRRFQPFGQKVTTKAVK